MWNLMRRWRRKAKGVTRFFYFFSLIGIPNVTTAIRVGLEMEMERRLAVTAIGLKRYKLKTGHWPQKLDALVPDYLAAVPRDCMSGELLRYHLNADGTFTLYSVGEDGKDDNGDATPTVAGAKPAFWGGRDTVWPLPATQGSVVGSR